MAGMSPFGSYMRKKGKKQGSSDPDDYGWRYRWRDATGEDFDDVEAIRAGTKEIEYGTGFGTKDEDEDK